MVSLSGRDPARGISNSDFAREHQTLTYTGFFRLSSSVFSPLVRPSLASPSLLCSPLVSSITGLSITGLLIADLFTTGPSIAGLSKSGLSVNGFSQTLTVLFLALCSPIVPNRAPWSPGCFGRGSPPKHSLPSPVGGPGCQGSTIYFGG